LTRQANPSVATYARKTGVDVRVAASAPTAQEAEALAAPVLEQVRGMLARWIWGEDADTLASVLTAALGSRTLGVIEAGSGGTVCTALADAPNFLDAAVTGDHARLITLGLTPITLNAHGVVSEQAARELAAGAREYLGAAVGLAVVTATVGEHAGQTYIALDTGELQKTAHLNWPGDAPQVRDRAAMAALALALRSLQTRDEVQA
ncbi:MAG: damage-inducible protein CinA, partial [Deinococcus sp.]|nr:damage-inducible protein CinA [Deinococcus sp.]